MHTLLQEANAILDNIAFPEEVLQAVALNVIDVYSEAGDWRRAVPEEVRQRYVLMLCTAHLMHSDVVNPRSSSLKCDIWANIRTDIRKHAARESQSLKSELTMSYVAYTSHMELAVINCRNEERLRVVRDRIIDNAYRDISEWNAPQWVHDLPPYAGGPPQIFNRNRFDHELRDSVYRLVRWELSVLNDVQEGITIEDSVMVLEQSAFREATIINTLRQHRAWDPVEYYVLNMARHVAARIAEASSASLRRLHAGRPLKALAHEKVWSMMPTSMRSRVVEQDAYNDLARFLAMDTMSSQFNSCSISSEQDE